MLDNVLFAAAPWQIFGGSSPLLKGIFAAVTMLLVVLIAISKVPFSYNLKNLTTRWLTSMFMVGSITLVVGIQIMLLAFVNGMYVLTESSGQPGNVMILSEGSTDEAFSNLGFADATEIETQEGVARDKNGQAMVSRETYLGISQQLTDRKTGLAKRRFLQVRGVDDPAMSAKVHGLKLMPGGEFFSESGVREFKTSRKTAIETKPGSGIEDERGSDSTPEQPTTKRQDRLDSGDAVKSESGVLEINESGETAIEAMLGSGIASELGSDRTPEQLATAKRRDRLDAGDTFKIGERTWYVTGVIEASRTVYDAEVWTRQSQVGPLFGKSNYTTFCVRARPDYRKDQRKAMIERRKTEAKQAFDEAVALKKKDKDAPNPVLAIVREEFSEEEWGAEMLKDYFANEYKKASLSPQIEQTYFSNLSSTNVQYLGMALVVSAIMSLGGLFGVMNTMFAAISQRTKDIGVLRLLGFKRWHIVVSFLLESMVLALVSGAIGCAVGSLCDGFTENSIVTGQGGGKFVVLRLTVDASTIAVGMMLSLIMGFFGGLIPSLSAMRLSALGALR